MKKKKEQELSLLDYYVRAAVVAVHMGIGLDYAFRKYIKPEMPENPPPLTREQAREIAKRG